MSDAELHNDAWVNLATGIGGPKDKSSGFAFSGSYIDRDQYGLEELYEEDHIAGRIVDALPEAVFAEGVTVEIADEEQKETILDALDSLDAEESIDQAMRWERLHGGAAIFVGAEDGRRFEEPLNAGNVRRVLYLHVFDRWELSPAKNYSDPQSPKFGQPSHYRVHPADSSISRQVGVIVHESRLIIFKGQRTTKRKLIENEYWGQSVLVRAFQPIKQYGGSLASTLALMADASQGIYKIKGLMSIIQAGQEAKLQSRMRVAEKLRSTVNAILLDADGEDYTRIATSLTELGNLIDRFQINVASAANMPATEIFGRSAAGMNATGENDTRAWYKQVAKAQRKSAKPAIEHILRLLLTSAQGPTQGTEPASWSVKFPPAWSPTALESAQIKKTKVETAILAQDAGVVTPEQIGRGLFSGSEWDGDIVLTPAEVDALRIVATYGGMSAVAPSAPVSTPELDGDDEGLEEAPEQLTQDEEGEELAVLNTRELAAQMTEHNVRKCEHGKPNRCLICGIERQRELQGVDSAGEAVWATAWRPIGARAPVTEEPDAGASESGSDSSD